MPVDFIPRLCTACRCVDYFEYGGFMSTAKHTPGPWSVKDKGIWEISVEAGGAICHINNKGTLFEGKDGSYGRSHGQMLSDANLIAAAPDLLAASKHVLMLIDAAVDSFPQSELTALRSAITNAEKGQE